MDSEQQHQDNFEDDCEENDVVFAEEEGHELRLWATTSSAAQLDSQRKEEVSASQTYSMSQDQHERDDDTQKSCSQQEIENKTSERFCLPSLLLPRRRQRQQGKYFDISATSGGFRGYEDECQDNDMDEQKEDSVFASVLDGKLRATQEAEKCSVSVASPRGSSAVQSLLCQYDENDILDSPKKEEKCPIPQKLTFGLQLSQQKLSPPRSVTAAEPSSSPEQHDNRSSPSSKLLQENIDTDSPTAKTKQSSANTPIHDPQQEYNDCDFPDCDFPDYDIPQHNDPHHEKNTQELSPIRDRRTKSLDEVKRKVVFSHLDELELERKSDNSAILKRARRISNKRKSQLTAGSSHSHIAQATAGVQAAKSIVGSRPKHWGSTRWHPISSSQPLSSSFASVLSQATKTRIARPRFSSTETIHKNDKITMRNALAAATAHSSSTSQRSIKKKSRTVSSASNDTSAKTCHSQQSDKNVDICAMNFRPAFLGDKSEKENSSPGINVDEITCEQKDEDNDDETFCVMSHPVSSQMGSFASQPSRMYATPINQNRRRGGSDKDISSGDNVTFSEGRYLWSESSSGRKGRKRKNIGPLTKELRSIRGQIEADRVRFQSGNYPYMDSSERMDVNDPRNRSEFYVDVSIVDSPIRWQTGGHVTVLGYVHHKVFTNGHNMRNRQNLRSNLSPLRTVTEYSPSVSTCDQVNVTTDMTDQERHEQMDETYPSFSWICFTSETAQEQRIKKGIQLRIYDCVSTPPGKTICGENVQNEMKALYQKAEENLPTLLCTQLCEPYPSCLLPLPAISDEMQKSLE